MQPPSLPRPSDRWIPWYFVAFFVILTSVLVPMCIIAVRTNTGVVTEQPYEKGLAYNKTIQSFEEQKALNWHGDLNITPSNDKIHADFYLTDSNRAALDKAEVKLWLVRPTHDGQDQNIDLKFSGNGHYQADVILPAHGLWEARVSANLQGHNYQVTKRIVVP